MFSDDINYGLIFFGIVSVGYLLDQLIFNYRMKSIKWPSNIDKLVVGIGKLFIN
jgi:hypothetical protein